MRRKLLLTLALLACAALAAAGVAAAQHGHAKAVQAASATFAATTVAREHQTTCTVTGGDTFQTTSATYTGTATSSDPRLAGTLTVRAHSVVDTTTGLGSVSGVFKVTGGSGNGAHGMIDLAVSGGQAVGLATGELKHPSGHLIASLSSGFDPGAGFSSGSIGTASSTGAGVVVTGGSCRHAPPKKHH